MAEETDKIVCFEERPHLFNQPDTDFKAEVVASGLKEGGYDAERTLISRRGDMRRGFSKDIQEIRSEYSHYDLTSVSPREQAQHLRRPSGRHLPQESPSVGESVERTGTG